MGRAALADLAADPAHAAVLVDFDGSLAPIVPEPADAAILPEAREALARLVGRIHRVGVVSGRPVAFLADQIDLPDVELAGLYGLVRRVGGVDHVDPRAEAYRPAVAGAVETARERLPGLLVEHKDLTVTLHWRRDPARQAEVEECATELSATFGLAIPQQGRMSVELRPPVDVDKGDAVEALLEGCDRACFAGDDVGDLPAFDRLDFLRESGALVDVCRIGVRSSEMPDDLAERVDVLVDGPAGLAAALHGLADALSERRRADP
ncbi:MAG: trehalose-phosphatase [Acidimicrobiia bacterium]|nr:trehalose-phosphatase [Acidimicrobiia bacterium]